MLEQASLIKFKKDLRLTAQALKFLCENSELKKAYLSPEFPCCGWLPGWFLQTLANVTSNSAYSAGKKSSHQNFTDHVII